MTETSLNKLAPKSARGRIQKFFTGPGRTKQEFKEESQINTILSGLAKSHLAENLEQRPTQYMDIPSGLDFETAQNIIAKGRSSFAALPAQMRADFDNDPVEFLAFVADPENADEMVEMGLAKPPASRMAPASDLDPVPAPEAGPGSPKPLPDANEEDPSTP